MESLERPRDVAAKFCIRKKSSKMKGGTYKFVSYLAESKRDTKQPRTNAGGREEIKGTAVTQDTSSCSV